MMIQQDFSCPKGITGIEANQRKDPNQLEKFGKIPISPMKYSKDTGALGGKQVTQKLNSIQRKLVYADSTQLR